MKIGLFGCGAYAMALSSILTENNCSVTMWTKFEEEKIQLENTRQNEKLIPNFKISDEIKLTTSIDKTIKDKDLLIIAIPIAFIDSLATTMSPYIKNNHILTATKGIEQKNGLFVDQILKKHLNTKNIGVISGPSFAMDIVHKFPIGLSIASENEKTIKLAKKCFENKYTKLRKTQDVIGVEICGAIKNVVAISAGILDGLGSHESTKAMMLTESIHDLKDMITALGGDKKTILSFAGLGDLVLTCTSSKSRNYTFGKMLGEKKSVEEINNYIKNTTVEGYYTLKSIYKLLNLKNISIPLINIIYDIVTRRTKPEKLIKFIVEKN